MKDVLRPVLATVLLFTALFGVVVPLGMTGVAGAVFPAQAGGSLIERDGKVIGSTLIGQNFTSDRYFHPRPSATAPEPYNGAASAASQLGPTSAPLIETLKERIATAGSTPVPADAVTASASGLDPHISPENAARQVGRIATARGMPEARVVALLAQNTEGRELGILGEPRVNVLRLNLALDGAR